MQSKDMMVRPPLNISTLIASWFFVGFIPFMQGTWGSLAVYPLYYAILYFSTGEMVDVLAKFWIAFILLLFLGWWSIAKYQEKTFTQDHKSVVIDEVLGMLFVFSLCFEKAYVCGKYLTRYFHYPAIVVTFALVFIIFRFFDIKKPFFIWMIDQNIKNALGVILDDLLAAFYTFLVILLLYNIIMYIR